MVHQVPAGCLRPRQHTRNGDIEDVLRRIAVALARQSWLRKLVISTPGVRDLAWRFVAGEDLDAGIVTLQRLASRGVGATLNHVGTHVHDAGQARAATDDLIVAIERIRAEGLSASVSVKLTQIGLDIDGDLCRSEFRRVLDAAAANDVFVWTDMEESPYVASTLAIFDEMRAAYGRDRVGIVLQAYLRHRPGDLEGEIAAGSRIRIVKGGYWEAPEVVHRVQAEIDQAFNHDVRVLLEGGHQPAIATHDPVVIGAVRRIVRERAIELGSFEFQMLYGVRADLQDQLVRDGFQVRAYVPYGGDWFFYFLGCIRQLPGGFVRRVKARFAARRRRPA